MVYSNLCAPDNTCQTRMCAKQADSAPGGTKEQRPLSPELCTTSTEDTKEEVQLIRHIKVVMYDVTYRS